VTPTELKAAGLALYGEPWRRELAKDLDVHISTIQRYLAMDIVPRVVELAIDGLHYRGVINVGE